MRTTGVLSHLRFPDGVEYPGGSGNEVRFNVSMPTDDDGHLGRECPDCNQIFRVSADDYDALPDDLTLWCAYCGHSDDHSEFTTQQQMERATRAAHDYASQLIGQMLDDTFGGMAHEAGTTPSSRSPTGRLRFTRSHFRASTRRA